MPKKPAKETFQLNEEQQISAAKIDVQTFEASMAYEQEQLRIAVNEVNRAMESIDDLAEKLKVAREKLAELTA